MIRFFLTVLSLGFSGIVAQIVLLKELIVLFSGNEMAIGLVIGTWIFGEALGAISLKFFKPNALNTGTFVTCALIFYLLFPLSIYLSAEGRAIMSIPRGVAPNLYQMGIISVISVFPVSFYHGLLFNFACFISTSFVKKRANPLAHVYFYEMGGTVLGGVLSTYTLLPHFNPYEIAHLLGLFSMLPLIFISGLEEKNRRVFILSLLFFLSFLVLFSSGTGRYLRDWTLNKIWEGEEVIFSKNSIYQNITVIKKDNEYTVWTDGTPFTTIPNPNIFYVEEVSHIPLLLHPLPKSILLLSIPLEAIEEVEKYPSVEKIDYVEIDPELVMVIEDLAKERGCRKKVRIHYMDGRSFVKKTKEKYDVVISGVNAPSALKNNRFFTSEFFKDIKRILNEEGLFFFHVSGSNYYSWELKMLNSSIFCAAKEIFRFVHVIPGDPNFFVLTDFPLDLSPVRLEERISSYNLNTKLISGAHLRYKLDEKRKEWFLRQMEGSEKLQNMDFKPFAFFFYTAYEATKISRPTYNFSYLFYTLKLRNILFYALLISFFLFLFWTKKGGSIFVPLSIFTTGLTMTVVEMILIFAFQVLFGSVFYEAGLLLTSFMGGSALGSIFVVEIFKKFDKKKAFFILDGTLIPFILLVLCFLSYRWAKEFHHIFLHFLILSLIFLSGFFVGAEFPLGISTYAEMKKAEERKGVGVIFASDLIGGFFGALGGSFLLFPILGLEGSLILLIGVKIPSFCLLLLALKK